MDLLLHPHSLSGSIPAIPSKSQAHRLLICAALADGDTDLLCSAKNADMEATADCLNALGAEIKSTPEGFTVRPIRKLPKKAVLPCRESGSTLRFLLPVAGALGVETEFRMEGRLPERPLSPLWEEMERMGCTLRREKYSLFLTGKLRPGDYSMAGNVSSQFFTGLLLACTQMPGQSRISVVGPLESKPYVTMTRQALTLFGGDVSGWTVRGGTPLHTPGRLCVEGDWSNAAFFLTANILGSRVNITGLDPESAQGDRVILKILSELDRFSEIPAGDIPDLVPILAVAAAVKQGAAFTGVGRLRLKESDRIATVAAMLTNLGISVETGPDTLTVHPGVFHGGRVSAAGDHRIAMAAAIAATAAQRDVLLTGAEAVKKSYPRFWEEYRILGGKYEQFIR